MVAASGTQRGFTPPDQAWMAVLAEKLDQTLSGGNQGVTAPRRRGSAPRCLVFFFFLSVRKSRVGVCSHPVVATRGDMASPTPLAECTLVEAALRCVYLRAPSSTRSVAMLRRGGRVSPPSRVRRPPPPSSTTRTRPHGSTAAHAEEQRDKAALTDEIAALWAKGDITVAYDPDPDAKHEAPPDKPARYARPSSSSRRGRNLVPTRAAPRFGGPKRERAPWIVCRKTRDAHPTEWYRASRHLPLSPPQRRPRDVGRAVKTPKLGKGGTPESRIAILHSLAQNGELGHRLVLGSSSRVSARAVGVGPKAVFRRFVEVAAGRRLRVTSRDPGGAAAGAGRPLRRAQRARRAVEQRGGDLRAAAAGAPGHRARCASDARASDRCRRRLASSAQAATPSGRSCSSASILPEEVNALRGEACAGSRSCARAGTRAEGTRVDAPPLWEGHALDPLPYILKTPYIRIAR